MLLLEQHPSRDRVNVPNYVRAGSKEYFKESCKLLRHANMPVNTKEIREMIQFVKKEKSGPSKLIRLTQVYGSLTGKVIRSKVKQINEEKKRRCGNGKKVAKRKEKNRLYKT